MDRFFKIIYDKLRYLIDAFNLLDFTYVMGTYPTIPQRCTRPN